MSLICGIVISALFLLAAGGFPSQILGLYTKDMSIINTGAVYFKIVAFSYIPMAVSNILSSWLRCKEHATIPFLASFGAVGVNTGLNYLLIFGKLGFSCMGIKGAAIATLISQLFNLVFIVIGFVLCTRKDGDKPVLSLHFKKITIRDYLVMIMPILISEFLWSLGKMLNRLFMDILAHQTLQHIYASGKLLVCIHCLPRRNYSGLLYR